VAQKLTKFKQLLRRASSRTGIGLMKGPEFNKSRESVPLNKIKKILRQAQCENIQNSFRENETLVKVFGKKT